VILIRPEAGDFESTGDTFARIYKNEAEWKTSDAFGRDDLLVLAKVADQAHSWICTATKADRELAR